MDKRDRKRKSSELFWDDVGVQCRICLEKRIDCISAIKPLNISLTTGLPEGLFGQCMIKYLVMSHAVSGLIAVFGPLWGSYQYFNWKPTEELVKCG